jgi:transposase
MPPNDLPGLQSPMPAREGPGLDTAVSRLPPETGRCVSQELEALDGLQAQIAQLEKRIRERVALAPSIESLTTLPGVGGILAAASAVRNSAWPCHPRERAIRSSRQLTSGYHIS